VRALAVLVVVWCRLARADDPGLEREPIELIGGHLGVRVLIGSELDAKHRVVFTSRAASLILAGYPTELVSGPSLKESIADDLAKDDTRIATARIEPLALAKPMVGYSVIPRSRARADELVYAAYIVSPDGTVDVLAFYVEADRGSDPSVWIDVARKIATTATPPVLDKMTLGSFAISVPCGSQRRRIGTNDYILAPDGGRCAISGDSPASLIPDTAQRSPGRILGKSIEWTTWTDEYWWAVADVDAVHILCIAGTMRSIARMRYIAGTLARDQDR
jgi:hypothetical protein